MAIETLLMALGLTGTLWPAQTTLTNNTAYDYIIIGGGTAGCVLASRLVQNTNYSVLLLEYGDDPSALSLLPGAFAFLPGTGIDYNYQSTLDTEAAGSQGNYTRITAGKMLGGSAGLNHLLWTRGVAEDYDYWAEITGDSSWKYDNVLPYFKKSENLTDDEVKSAYSDIHGTNGPTQLTRQTHDETADYLSAWEEVGNPEVVDITAATGYTQPLLTINTKGIRQTPAYTYLYPVKDNSNLFVSKNTKVTKVIFEDKTAVGVQAVYKDTTYTLKANKEVIVSAGVFGTPQVLLLSGVGPQDHLTENNIEVIEDLPVGEGLQMPTAVVLVHKTVKSLLPIPNPTKLAAALDQTQLPFPVMAGNVALEKSSSTPNYQTYNLLLPHDTPYLTLACTQVYGYRLEICLNWQKEIVSRDGLHSVVAEIEPKSRGTVRLNSTDPFDDPKITTGFYSNTEDLDKMLANIKDFMQIVNSTFFKDEEAELVGLDFDECAGEESGSDEFWKCYIKQRSISAFLVTSSCPMGTVVDGELKIKGLSNIRIVDASVIPKLTHGAPYSSVMMVAEKAADMIIAGA